MAFSCFRLSFSVQARKPKKNAPWLGGLGAFRAMGDQGDVSRTTLAGRVLGEGRSMFVVMHAACRRSTVFLIDRKLIAVDELRPRQPVICWNGGSTILVEEPGALSDCPTSTVAGILGSVCSAIATVFGPLG
jgi:hypothetical protein